MRESLSYEEEARGYEDRPLMLPFVSIWRTMRNSEPSEWAWILGGIAASYALSLALLAL